MVTSSNSSNWWPVVYVRLIDDPNNAKCTHHSIQDDILRSAAALVTGDIVREINEAGVFSLQADEKKDLTKEEELSLARYVKDDQTKERFIKFTACSDLTALNLCDTILNTIRENAVSIAQCVAQCYGGAFVMCGHLSGVQQRIKVHSHRVIYTHCFAHSLNLVVMEVVGAIWKVGDMLAVLQRKHNFLSTTVVHARFVAAQKTICHARANLELQFQVSSCFIVHLCKMKFIVSWCKVKPRRRYLKHCIQTMRTFLDSLVPPNVDPIWDEILEEAQGSSLNVTFRLFFSVLFFEHVPTMQQTTLETIKVGWLPQKCFLPLRQKVADKLDKRFLNEENNVVYSGVVSLTPGLMRALVNLHSITKFCRHCGLIEEDSRPLLSEIYLLADIFFPLWKNQWFCITIHTIYVWQQLRLHSSESEY